MTVNKVTLTEPGRYTLAFGWLTITADHLAIWQAYLDAEFTDRDPAEVGEETIEEFRLGTFELRETLSLGEKCQA